jgi:chemotaxis methyl-accepting protein methylase
MRILGKSPMGACVRLNEWVWHRLPRSLAALPPLGAYGRFFHSLVLLHAAREMFLGTFFFRNRPELELIRRLSEGTVRRRPVRIAVLGCSNGAEVYSIRWALRSLQSGRELVIHAVDISQSALECAQKGTYLRGVSELVREPVCALMTPEELREMFDDDGERLEIKPWLKEGIEWHLGDAADRRMRECLGPQDIVVANRFLCHMAPADADRCLRRIAQLVAPGGYLFVSGVDLDVRTKVASELNWQPVQDLLEAVHDGDSSLRKDWPCKYWGLEPLDKRRPDWTLVYASAFQVGEPPKPARRASLQTHRRGDGRDSVRIDEEQHVVPGRRQIRVRRSVDGQRSDPRGESQGHEPLGHVDGMRDASKAQ